MGDMVTHRRNTTTETRSPLPPAVRRFSQLHPVARFYLAAGIVLAIGMTLGYSGNFVASLCLAGTAVVAGTLAFVTLQGSSG